MASFVESDSLLQELEKLATVPPFRPEKPFNYKVKGFAIESVLTASSTFEAATKFAFWANEVQILQLKPTETTTVEVLDSDNDRYVYDIYLHDSKPLVELSYFVKHSQSLDDTNDNAAVSGSRAEEDQEARLESLSRAGEKSPAHFLVSSRRARALSTCDACPRTHVNNARANACKEILI